jgi:hypothetical protein
MGRFRQTAPYFFSFLFIIMVPVLQCKFDFSKSGIIFDKYRLSILYFKQGYPMGV